MDDVLNLRLALRVEGSRYVAYYADGDSMDGAIEIASMHSGVIDNDLVRERFMEFAREVFDAIMLSAFGVRPEWNGDPTPAPEHERAGRA